MGKYKIIPTVYYIVHMVKNKEFMFVRFYCEDFEKGQCGAKLIQSKYCKPYKDAGWEILDIEKGYSSKTSYN